MSYLHSRYSNWLLFESFLSNFESTLVLLHPKVWWGAEGFDWAGSGKTGGRSGVNPMEDQSLSSLYFQACRRTKPFMSGLWTGGWSRSVFTLPQGHHSTLKHCLTHTQREREFEQRRIGCCVQLWAYSLWVFGLVLSKQTSKWSCNATLSIQCNAVVYGVCSQYI